MVPLGQLKSNFNYNLDDKRVLNFENVVNDDDNIKQVKINSSCTLSTLHIISFFIVGHVCEMVGEGVHPLARRGREVSWLGWLVSWLGWLCRT